MTKTRSGFSWAWPKIFPFMFNGREGGASLPLITPCCIILASAAFCAPFSSAGAVTPQTTGESTDTSQQTSKRVHLPRRGMGPQARGVRRPEPPQPEVPKETPNTFWSGLKTHMTVEAGIAANPWTKSARNFGQFYLDRANTVTLNQILGSVSRDVADIGGGYGLGFVAEAMYGSDSRFDATLGMGDRALSGMYQWAPTQAHIDLHTPWIFKKGIDLQIGQSYGLMGSEGTGALTRPFYSFDYSSDFIVPFQTVGIIATAHVNSDLDVITGIDAGNSTTFGRARNNKRPSGYLGVAFAHLMDGRLEGHVIGRVGPQGHDGDPRISPEGWASAGIGSAAVHRMQYNADLLLTYHASKTLAFMFDGIYLHDEVPNDDLYGAAAYLAWDINPELQFNARAEVFRDNTGVMITSYPGTTAYSKQMRNLPYPFYAAPPTTYGDLTVGVRYMPGFVNRHLPLGQFSIRPELRVDQSLNGTHPFNREASLPDPVVRNGDSTMFWFSCDVIWSF